jgi:hypothetical protein
MKTSSGLIRQRDFILLAPSPPGRPLLSLAARADRSRRSSGPALKRTVEGAKPSIEPRRLITIVTQTIAVAVAA